MRIIEKNKVIETVKKLCIDACLYIDSDTLEVIKICHKKESSNLAKNILSTIIENDEIAATSHMPMCQDTGVVVVFLEIGRDIHFKYDIYDAINEGIRQGYKDGYLRKSIVGHPINRSNTNDNTPGIIHTKLVEGDKLKITLAPKGGGSENMSRLKMLVPSDGIQGIKDFVLETVKLAGGKACPPLIVGVGIGGNLEKSCLIAKEALLRDIKDTSSDEYAAKLEQELLTEINNLNVGPMGLKGDTTALAVKVNTYPCHIASLPIAVNLQCHASRHKEEIL